MRPVSTTGPRLRETGFWRFVHAPGDPDESRYDRAAVRPPPPRRTVLRTSPRNQSSGNCHRRAGPQQIQCSSRKGPSACTASSTRRSGRRVEERPTPTADWSPSIGATDEAYRMRSHRDGGSRLAPRCLSLRAPGEELAVAAHHHRLEPMPGFARVVRGSAFKVNECPDAGGPVGNPARRLGRPGGVGQGDEGLFDVGT